MRWHFPCQAGRRAGSIGVMKTLTSELAEAIKPIGRSGRTSKPRPVILAFDSARATVSIEEAAHGLFHVEFDGVGDASFSAQVDGLALQRVAKGFPASLQIEVTVTRGSVLIQCCGFQAVLPRYDIGAVGGVTQSRPAPDRRHKGKVEPSTVKRQPQPQGDTWLFSAQVPFPDPTDTAGDAD